MSEKPLNVLSEQILKVEEELVEKKKELVELRRRAPKREIHDYTFKRHDGSEVMLSSLFGEKQELIVVHNMGKGCRYCTLWADGFNGVYHHMENRVPFVVVSPDEYTVQAQFASGRGWKFRMFSSHATTFFKDMGFESEKQSPWPGVSAFTRDGAGKIYQAASTYFGPGDDFCAVWSFLDLLPDGPNGWEPQYKY